MALRSFFVFNPTFSKREEDEHLKLLFFWPEETSFDNQMTLVGLSEALVKYTNTFSDFPVDALHTLKNRQVYLNPEPDYWISLIVDLSSVQKPNKDGKPSTEYLEDDVQDVILQSIVKLSYQMFKLFNNTFASTVSSHGREALIHKLALFYPKFLASVDFTNAGVLDTLSGLHFLPLDKNSYLRIQTFINLVEFSYPQVRYTVFLYQGQVVWSGLEQEDMRIVYQFLTGGLLPLASTFSPPSSSSHQQPTSSHKSGFVTGPESLSEGAAITAPTMHITIAGVSFEAVLVIYQCNGATCCFFVDKSYYADMTFYRALHAAVSKNMEGLDAMIRDHQLRRAPSYASPASMEAQYKYLYFNHMNLAQKVSFNIPGKRGALVASTSGHTHGGPTSPSGLGLPFPVSADIIRHLTDMHVDFIRSGEEGEVILKTETDCWLVARKSDQREFFVILNQKNANLIDIHEEVRKLCVQHFNNIFFLD